MSTPTDPRPATGATGPDEGPTDSRPGDGSLATEVLGTPAGAAGPSAAGATPTPTYKAGPAPFALTLALLGLLTAAGVLVAELTDVDVAWDDLGPWTAVGLGVVIVVVGVIGLRSNRSRG